MPPVLRFGSLPSTMTTAAELAAAGAEHGTAVVADEQTAGQGRLGRTWYSERDAGLYVTFLLRLKLCPDSLPVTTLALGLAAAEAIRNVTQVQCDIRWPNDLLVGERKVAGILAQLTGGALLAGVGVNVNQGTFPEDVADIATSLRIVTGREQSRESLLEALHDAVLRHTDALMREGKAPVIAAFEGASSYVRGKRVMVEAAEGVLVGTTDGLDAQGFLRLKRDDGTHTLIVAGGVRPLCS